MSDDLRDKGPEELVDGAKAGSSAAFSELVRRYEGPLFNFLLQRSPGAGEAEDLCQETFLRAWQKIDLYRPEWRFSTWLFTLARRLAASRTRSAPPPAAGDEAIERAAAIAHDPSLPIVAREERENLWSLAARVLSAEQRSALWLRYAEDLPVDEIARILGRPRVTVRVILFRARATLGRHLEPEPIARDQDSRGRRSSAVSGPAA